MKNQLLIAAVLFAAAFARAEDEPRGAEQAKFEIERRGPSVQIIDDQIRDDGQEAFFTALAIPPDDSHKWFLTVVYDQRNAQTDKLKADLLSAKELAPWAQLKDRGKGTYDVYSTDASFMHVNFESRNNPFRPEKWKFIKPQHCPSILIQLPLNGDWGRAGLVVNQRTGYDGNAAELAEWIRDSIKTYSEAHADGFRDARAKRVSAAGHAGHRSEDIGAYTAPFPVLPKELGQGADPMPPFPADLVVVKPKKPEQLTLDEIRAAVPGAPLEFAVAQLDAKVKTVADVLAAWGQKQQQDALAKTLADIEKAKADFAKQLEDAKKKPSFEPAPPAKPSTPDKPAVDEEKPVPVQERPIIAWLLGSGVFLLMLDVALKWFGVYAKSTPGLTDDAIAVALVKLREILTRPAQSPQV